MADGSYGTPAAKKLSRTEQDALIKAARERMDQAWQKDRRNRQEMAIDLRFLASDQWPDDVKREREADGRPMLTINRCGQFLYQVTNPIREADLSIKTAPVDGNSDPKTAQVYDGLLKQIQYQSSAKAAYARVAEHQAGCGIGWLRVCTEHTDDTTFEQELRIKAIPNPLSVYDDPGAVEPDRSDSNWRFITQMMPKADFKARWPKAAETDVERSSDGLEGMYWSTDDEIRIAEYWTREPVKKTLALLVDGQTVDMERIKGLPLEIVRTREVDCYEVKMYLISGAEVLEGPFDWAGKYLPQVPAIGAEVPVESGTYRKGIIRDMRDPQALYNYYRTAAAESIALAPKAPFIGTDTMFAKHQEQWNNANRKNRPWLAYTPDERVPGGKPERQPPPDSPTALINETQLAAEDMKGTTGIYDASLGGKSNETSGVAINQRQIQGDTANYHYGDNFQRSLEHLGRILVDLIPRVYDTQRIIRILGEDDAEEFVEINKVISMRPDGTPEMLHDLSAGRFDVRVRIGRSADTKRLEMAQFMTEFVKNLNEQQRMAVMDLVAKTFDSPGADEIAKRLRNMVPPELMVDPDDPEAPPPPSPLDDPAVQLELGEKQAKIELTQQQARETSAKADKLEMEIGLAVGAANAGMHPMQQEARNASLSADNQELTNELDRDQAQRGEHEKQRAYADIAKQLEMAKAQKQMQSRAVH